MIFVFFFKQKTAYELRISDWSSDVCSSDLQAELDAARFEIDARHLYLHFIGQAVAHAGAFAAQFMQRLVVLEILAAQFRHVHQAFDMQGIQGDEYPETGPARHGEIGSASWRARVGKYIYISVVGVTINKKKHQANK